MVTTHEFSTAAEPRRALDLLVADCASLRLLADLTSCRDGAVYRTAAAVAAPSAPITLENPPRTLRLPPVAATVPTARRGDGSRFEGLLVTPGALPAGMVTNERAVIDLLTDRGRADVEEEVRNIVAAADPRAVVEEIALTVVTGRFTTVRRALLVCAVVTLLLIRLSLLAGVGEQLRDRRRVLAVLAAFGTRRRTLGWSVLWQTTLPVTVGLALAVPAGIGLGAVLQLMIDRPVRVDLTAATIMAAAAGGVVLMVTAASLPMLWRIMRAEELRSE